MTQSIEMTLESNAAGQEYIEAMLAVRNARALLPTQPGEPYSVLEFGLRRSEITPDKIDDLSTDVLKSIARNAAVGFYSKQKAEQANDRLFTRQMALAELAADHINKEVIAVVINEKAAAITEYKYDKWQATHTVAHGIMNTSFADAMDGDTFRLQAFRTTLLGKTTPNRNKAFIIRPRRSILEAPGLTLQILDS